MTNCKHFTIALLSILLFWACNDDTEYVESKEPASILIKNIESNTIGVYTAKTFQVELEVLPSNAEIKEPIQYSYSSSDVEIFDVSASGLITANGIGQAVLTVKSTNYENLQTKAIVKVENEFFAVSEIKIDETHQNLILAASSETVVGMVANIKDKFTVLPENASIKDVEFTSSKETVVKVSEEGKITGVSVGEAIVTIKAKDGSNTSAIVKVTVKEPTAYTSIDRAGWLVTPSHKLPADAAISNAPESLIDGSVATCLSMVKPDKSYGGIKVEKDEEVYFIIDRNNKEEFDYVYIQHRNNSYAYLRPYTYTLFGKNEEAEEFVPIYETINAIPTSSAFYMAIPSSKYRFVKFRITPDTKTTSGSTMQIAELELGRVQF